MGLHTAFTALAEVIDTYESRGRSIQAVEASPAENGAAVVDVTLSIPVSLRESGGADRQLTPKNATLTSSGDLQVEFASPVDDLPTPDGVSVSVVAASAGVTEDGLLLTVELTIDATAACDKTSSADTRVDQHATTDVGHATATSGDGANDTESQDDESLRSAKENSANDEQASQTSDEPLAGAPDDDEADSEDAFAEVRDESVPPYEDTAYLQALYDECDNFTEIAERIQMDVSSETVRRYMIEADIHEPNTYDTSSDDADETAEPESEDDTTGDAEASVNDEAATPATPESSGPAEESVRSLPDEQLVTDGLGLPADVQVRDVADAVVDSDTVYEVQRSLRLERGQTRDLLEELNLLDLVLRRLADEPDHVVSYETVAGRIRQCTPHSA